MNQSICPGPRSALLRFTDTRAGLIFCDAYIADLMEARLLLDLYPGGVYLYLDDYAQYHRLGPFRSSPVFFRSDVPWNELKTELTVQGFHMERIFLQRYSDSVFFFFGFDPLGNVVFSMLAHWEIDKIYTALAGKAFTLCGRSDAERYGPFPWSECNYRIWKNPVISMVLAHQARGFYPNFFSMRLESYDKRFFQMM